MPRAAALAGPAIAPRVSLVAAEVAAIERLAPALEAAARADEALVRAVGAAGSVRCFGSLQELDAAAGPILELLYKRAALDKRPRGWARKRARAAFCRLRTALFPGASRRTAPRHVFAASAKPRSAPAPALDPPTAVGRKAPADRTAPQPRLPPPLPPLPPSAEEAAAAAAASAAAAEKRRAAADARDVAARLAREAAVAEQNERDGRALVADALVVTKGAGVTVAETAPGTRKGSAAICISTLAAVAAAVAAPVAAAGEGDEGGPLLLDALRGFVSHVIVVAAGAKVVACVVNASVSVTALEAPAELGAATCSARPVTQNHVELSGEVALARYHSVQAHSDVELTFRNSGAERLLLTLQGRVLENGYVTVEAIEA
jgi:hypothetical protein